jgi:hypothetical protein
MVLSGNKKRMGGKQRLQASHPIQRDAEEGTREGRWHCDSLYVPILSSYFLQISSENKADSENL